MSQSNVKFVDCTLQSYLNLSVKDSSTIYVVSTNVTFDQSADPQDNIPSLIFKGDKLIGNSGLLTRHSTNGIITIDSNIFSSIISDTEPYVFELIQLNTNIIPGTVSIKLYSSEEHTDTPITFNDVESLDVSLSSAPIKSTASDDVSAYIDYSSGRVTFDGIIDDTLMTAANSDLLVISYNNQINIINPDSLSTNITGVLGQTLFIIDQFTNEFGLTSNSTYLYFWEEVNGIGRWKNANLNYVNRISIGDKEITSVELGRLLELLY